MDIIKDETDSIMERLKVFKEQLAAVKKYKALAICAFPLSVIIFVIHVLNLFSVSFVSFLLLVIVGSCLLGLIVCGWLAVTFTTFALGLFFAVGLLCPWFLGFHLFCSKFSW